MKTTRGWAWLVAAGVLAGCQPAISVNVGLGGSGGKIREASVGKGEGAEKIAIVEVRGLIQDGPRFDLLGEGANPVHEFVSALDLAARDDAVKAVVVRISSPGGTVAASETLYRALRGFAERTGKPVVISMGEVAASGGYYLALAGDEVVAQPTTITGSIGVIFPTLNASEGLAKIGVRSRSVTSGPNKDLVNPLEPVREGHMAIVQGLVDDFYAGFKGLVLSRRRWVRAEDVARATDGRVFTGREALALGLVDRLGGLEEAIERAKERAGVPDARVVKYLSGAGRSVQSVYATAELTRGLIPPTASPQGAQVNLVQVNLGDFARSPGAVGTSGFYYLWWPEGM